MYLDSDRTADGSDAYRSLVLHEDNKCSRHAGLVDSTWGPNVVRTIQSRHDQQRSCQSWCQLKTCWGCGTAGHAYIVGLLRACTVRVPVRFGGLPRVVSSVRRHDEHVSISRADLTRILGH